VKTDHKINPVENHNTGEKSQSSKASCLELYLLM